MSESMNAHRLVASSPGCQSQSEIMNESMPYQIQGEHFGLVLMTLCAKHNQMAHLGQFLITQGNSSQSSETRPPPFILLHVLKRLVVHRPAVREPCILSSCYRETPGTTSCIALPVTSALRHMLLAILWKTLIYYLGHSRYSINNFKKSTIYLLFRRREI